MKQNSILASALAVVLWASISTSAGWNGHAFETLRSEVTKNDDVTKAAHLLHNFLGKPASNVVVANIRADRAPDSVGGMAPQPRPLPSPGTWTLISTSSGGTRSSSSIRILERGIYRAETIGRTAAPGTTGVINTVRNPQLITATTVVVGHVGVRFGLHYSVVGGEPGSEKFLRLVILFPPEGLRNPQTGQLHYQNAREVTVAVGTAHYWEYHFENPWEIAEGIWLFEFWDGAKKIGQQRFCVHRLEKIRMPTARLPTECRQDLLG